MSEVSYELIGNSIAVAIPLLFLAFILDSKDGRQVVLFFCWGFFAGVLAFHLNNYFAPGQSHAQRLTLSIAPLIEEICKGAPLLLFLNRRRYPRITKLIVFCAMASGIGFSIQESMYYFTVSSRELSDIADLVTRSFTTALMHGTTTAAVGIGLMLLNEHKKLLVPLVFGLFALSATIHALFNLLLLTDLAVVAAIIPIAMLIAGWWFVRYEVQE